MLVTVVTPSYNQGQFLEKTIKSVINQTYGNVEYIIIDACSTDKTVEILEKYKNHPKVSKIVVEKDNGQTDAINKGFKMATGDIVGWINSDDMLYPTIIEKTVAAFKNNPSLGITIGDILLIDEHGNSIKKRNGFPKFGYNYLLNTFYYTLQQGSFYLKEAVEKSGYLETTLNYCMDLDIYLKILSEYEGCYLNTTAGYFRRMGGTKTATGDIDFLREILSTLKRFKSYPLSENMRRIYWRILKLKIKSILMKLRGQRR